jgi:hypothetical protein
MDSENSQQKSDIEEDVSETIKNELSSDVDNLQS